MTVKRYYRKLILERIIMALKLACIPLFALCSLWVMVICLTSVNDTNELNKCLKTHTFNYCNKR